MKSSKLRHVAILPACLLATASIYAEQHKMPVDDQEIILIEDESPAEEIILIDESGSDETILIEETQDEITLEPETADSEEIVLEESAPQESDKAMSAESTFSVGIDRAWLEYAALLETDQPVDSLGYGHLEMSADWKPQSPWEGKISLRLDGYRQTGTPDWTELDADYGETYLRYRGEKTRLTLGAQELIWGRIDEIPPTDRLSSVDANRFILDDLQDRRRARLMLRAETFSGSNKFDFVYLPTFREAELADVDSIWYPIDRDNRRVLGLASPVPGVAPITIVDDAPDMDHAVGLRWSRTSNGFDYAVTAQHGRQTLPYFSFDGISNFTARYPRSTSLGGDFAFESAGITWRFEAAWLSDVPTTTNALVYNEVEGLNWAGGMEFYPGDGDTRVNLQLAGNHLIDADNVLERDEVYNFNGSLNIPFAQERWRANIRFFFGLDEQDIYLNPEIAFVGWEPHEFYLEAHYFDGDPGTLGGFHEDHSIISAGWRASF